MGKSLAELTAKYKKLREQREQQGHHSGEPKAPGRTIAEHIATSARVAENYEPSAYVKSSRISKP